MTLLVQLQHRFDRFTLDVGFEAPHGVTALFGRSGSGKTTIINAVAGLLHPDQGKVQADGVMLTDTSAGLHLPPHRRKIGYVFQDARLFPHLTVRQNLLYGRWFARNAEGPSLARIVDLLGITELLSRRPAGLSGGEKQRVAIGRAILSNPRLLLLDEPLAALDDARKADILPYLERMRDELRLPVVYVSHSLAEVARLANTVVLIDAGRLVAAGPARDILADARLAPALGLREVGAILNTRIAAQEQDGLTQLQSCAGPLWLPRVTAPVGATLRVRILAQDVMVATRRPTEISALNILPGTVQDIRQGDGPGALVKIDLGGEAILARITARSAVALALTPGKPVFAVVKSVSVAQENVGGGA